MSVDQRTFIITGDVHMSNRLPYAQPSENGRTDRLDDQLRFWRQVEVKAAKYDAHGVIITGDLFDKATLDPVTLTETVLALERLAGIVPTWVLPGNHDAATTRGGRYNVEALAAIEGVTVLRDGDVIGVDPWLRLYACPYASIQQNMESVKKMRAELDKRTHNVLLFHNSVVGCKHLAWLCDDGVEADELCEGWDEVISGHFHTKQRFGRCGRYLGAPMQHHFGDVDERRGFFAVSFQRGADTKYTFIPTRLPQFHKISGYRVEDVPPVDEGDYVRLVIECTTADWKMIEPEALHTVEALKAMGVRAHYRHKPVYHHHERDLTSDDMDSLSMEEMTSKYVKSADVVLGELDPGILLELGRQFLAEARASK
jgi:DNA repair exonuclease SbcCD nuclease subunit